MGMGIEIPSPQQPWDFIARFLALMNDDLISAADKKLFRQISNETHCLHPLLSKQKLLKYLIISEIAATNICFGKLKHNTIQKQFPQQMFIFLYLVLYVFTVCCV